MNFQSLQYLGLAFNDFEGAVPTEGVFRNASVTFIEGNNKLCGGIPELHLPRCNLKMSRRRTSLPKLIAIATVSGLSGVTLAYFLLVCFWLRKKRKQPTESSMENSLLQLSYQSILKATKWVLIHKFGRYR